MDRGFWIADYFGLRGLRRLNTVAKKGSRILDRGLFRITRITQIEYRRQMDRGLFRITRITRINTVVDFGSRLFRITRITQIEYRRQEWIADRGLSRITRITQIKYRRQEWIADFRSRITRITRI